MPVSGSRLKAPGLFKEIEADHVGLAVGAAGAEADRAEDAGHEGHVVAPSASPSVISPLLAQSLHHVQAEDVGLAFFQGRSVILHRMTHSVALPSSVFLIPRPWATSWNMVLPKNDVKGDVPTLVLRDQHVPRSAPGSGCTWPAWRSSAATDGCPSANCTSSSLGRLIAMVFDPALLCTGVVDDVVGIQVGI